MNKFVFALHRGGSSVLGGIVKNCAMASDETAVVLGAGPQSFQETGPTGAALRVKAGDAPEPDSDEELMESAEFRPQIDNWRKHAGVFAPIRRADFFPPDFFSDGDLAVLNVRDPRDCMVSGYFGFLRLHGGGLEDKKRQNQYAMGIDDYVMTHLLDRYIGALQNYIDLRTRIPSLHIMTYEKMVTSFEEWFDEFYETLSFNRDKYGKLLPRQAAKFAPPDEEDIDKHKRQMLPGDYLRKLKPETIDEINDKMGPQLEYFGYN